MMHWGNGLGMGFGGGLFMVIFWILAIVGIAYIIKLIMEWCKRMRLKISIDTCLFFE
jgi:hypothetical protein